MGKKKFVNEKIVERGCKCFFHLRFRDRGEFRELSEMKGQESAVEGRKLEEAEVGGGDGGGAKRENPKPYHSMRNFRVGRERGKVQTTRLSCYID